MVEGEEEVVVAVKEEIVDLMYLKVRKWVIDDCDH